MDLGFSVFDLVSYATGYSSGNLNGGSIHGVMAGVRGPFTQSQWMELEHQALIYKYITANVPVPSNLLLPIRKALDSVGFSTFSAGALRPNTCKFVNKKCAVFSLHTRFALIHFDRVISYIPFFLGA